MSRLDEECIMAVVRNRSGIDSGEIDYSLFTAKFDKLSNSSLEDCIQTLNVLLKKCEEKLGER